MEKGTPATDSAKDSSAGTAGTPTRKASEVDPTIAAAKERWLPVYQAAAGGKSQHR
ncbi:hypothetical protein GCM10023195_01350 [Actinoallomurus liliacearum]|uniref:Uncharacterized protein n=1 Tax=Actinoallomurus liliacearum TaxID=1080073 RepID=A0ABP8TBB9_9ACTN